MKILIAYATTEGQTRRICRYCADVLIDEGHSVELLDTGGGDGLDLTRFDAAILAASLHIGAFQKDMQRFARAHADGLAGLQTMFLSVSLAVASGEAGDLAELDQICGRFFDETGWHPGQVTHVAGAFRFTQYDFFRSLALRWIAHRQGQQVDTNMDREYTDWQALRRAVLAFAGPADSGQGHVRS